MTAEGRGAPEWSEQLDQLLRDVVVGELSLEDPRVRSALESSSEFRARLAAHRAAERRLSDYAGERERVLGASGERPESRLEEQALEGFRAHAARRIPAAEGRVRSRPGRGPARALTVTLALAAAALFAMFLLRPWLRSRDGGPPPLPDDGGRMLDSEDGLELLEPLAGATDVKRFAWKPSRDTRVLQYELAVYDTSLPGAEVLVFRTKTPRTEFLPRVPLPHQLSWSVQALDATGSPIGHAVSARLSY